MASTDCEAPLARDHHYAAYWQTLKRRLQDDGVEHEEGDEPSVFTVCPPEGLLGSHEFPPPSAGWPG
jgi:hypothetical protein